MLKIEILNLIYKKKNSELEVYQDRVIIWGVLNYNGEFDYKTTQRVTGTSVTQYDTPSSYIVSIYFFISTIVILEFE